MLQACLALIPIAALCSALLCALLLRFSHRVGALDSAPIEGQVKLSAKRVPNTGGVAIFLTLAAPIAGALILAHLPESVTESLPDLLRGALPGIRNEAPTALTLLVCLIALHALGLVDDRKPLPAMFKLFVMLAAAAAVPLLTDTRLLSLADGHAGGPWLSILLTTLWIATITNAFNFMDNMDGLAASTAATAAAGFLAATLLNGQWFVAGALALVVGACLGFLVFNKPPAKLYMGDGGSLVLGFTLAFLTVRTTYYIDPEAPAGALTAAHPIGGGWYGVLMPFAVLAIPLYDLVAVSAIRIKQGRSPFLGDTQHFSHRLLKRGLSVRQTLGVTLALTAVTGLCGVLLATPIAWWQAVLLGCVVVCVLLTVILLEVGTSSRAGPLPGREP